MQRIRTSANVWFQEVYAYYRPFSILNIKAGKIYRKTGAFWDDSFFGNLQYMDGHKLNPDWGLSIEGEQDLARGRVRLAYAAQYMYGSDGVNGSIDYARSVGPAPDVDPANARVYSPSPEGVLDSTGARVGQLKHVVDGRFAVTVRPSRRFTLTLGLSGLTGIVRRVGKSQLTMTTVVDEARFSHAIVDATAVLGPFRGLELRLLAEYMHQFGPGLRDADYFLAGPRFVWRNLAVYAHVSWVRYALSPAVHEIMIVPGVSYTIGGGLSVLVEYDEWRRRDPRGVPAPLQADSPDPVTGYYTYDRSLNLVLAYSY